MRGLGQRAVGGTLGLVIACCLAVTAYAQDQRFDKPAHLLNWISAYKDDPQPRRLPEFVKAAARLGLLRDAERSGIYFGFVAGVLADNQLQANALVDGMFPLKPENQLIVIKGIAYSGLPQWPSMLERIAERMPARKVLLLKYLSGKAKPLQKASFDEGPQVLDAWWGFYFATGSYDAALRIIAALKWANEENNLERLTVGSMAKWTLATNASRDKDLLDFLRAEQNHQPKHIRKELRDIVLAAENFEVAKLQRKTLASIDKLKKHGPAKWRKWSWWGRAGQIALAAGCVAASALGQVQLGLPCVISGAASSGLMQLLSLQQSKP